MPYPWKTQKVHEEGECRSLYLCKLWAWDSVQGSYQGFPCFLGGKMHTVQHSPRGLLGRPNDVIYAWKESHARGTLSGYEISENI